MERRARQKMDGRVEYWGRTTKPWLSASPLSGFVSFLDVLEPQCHREGSMTMEMECVLD